MDFLFTPFSIKGLKLANRIVMPPLASFLTGADGSINGDTVEHYRKRAAGGPAMVIAEAAAVSAEGVVSLNQARIDRDRCIEGLSRLARTMEAEGAVAAIQLHHAGRQTSARVIGTKPLAPSPIPCPSIKGDVHPLSIHEIHDLVEKFGDSAVRAMEAGFRLIEIHGAHGYLVGQFLSPFSNQRDDQYGGDTENRARFAVEIIGEIRRRLGSDFPLSFKISAREYVEGGLDIEESIRLLRHIVKAGADIVQVSAGSDATPEWISQPSFMAPACLADSAGRTRAALDVPVMAVGRINHPHTARQVLSDGKADLVCIGRGLLADPEMPKKAAAGREKDIRVCIACNSCMASIFKKGRVECLVNPSLGREREMEITPARRRKKIIVAGGGPAGMNAAWVAAMRGHKVVLFEKQRSLGGQLREAAEKIAHKREIFQLLGFHERQIQHFEVDCRLGSAATAEIIRAECPDAVILATGAIPLVPELPGASGPNTLTYRQALNGYTPVQEPVAIVGGGATGCEISLHLAELGLPVTLVEELAKPARDLEAMTRKVLLRKMKDRGVRLLTETRLVSVEADGLRAVKSNGESITVPAGKVIFATGSRPDTRLREQLCQDAYELHTIGDCLSPMTAKEAILQAARISRSI